MPVSVDAPRITLTGTMPAFTIRLAVGSSTGGAVDSVNGQTGVVVLDADDVGAATEADITAAIDGIEGMQLYASHLPLAIEFAGGSFSDANTMSLPSASSSDVGSLIVLTEQAISTNNDAWEHQGAGVFTRVPTLTAANKGMLLVVRENPLLSNASQVLRVTGANTIEVLPASTAQVQALIDATLADYATESYVDSAVSTFAQADLQLGDSVGGAPRTGHRFEFPGNAVGILSTPTLGEVFTTGLEIRAVVWPDYPGQANWFSEIASHSDDGTGSIDNFELAIFSADGSVADYIDSEPRLFFESVPDGGEAEVLNRLNVRAGLHWGNRVEVMNRIDFGSDTLTGYVRVPYALDDDATYVTSSIDDAVFRKVGEVVDVGYGSVNSSALDWWIGNNFYGAIESVVWRNGADGALIDDVRATDAEPGDTSFTSTGGRTWTIGAGVSVVKDAEERLDALEAAPSGGDHTPWNVTVDTRYPLVATVGNWDVVVGSAGVGNAYTRNPDRNQNESAYTDVLLGAGTWVLEIIYAGEAQCGIAHWALDGTPLTSFGAASTTIDTYTASLTWNIRASITGIVIPATDKYRLSVTMATKNASATHYRLNLIAARLRRTA